MVYRYDYVHWLCDYTRNHARAITHAQGAGSPLSLPQSREWRAALRYIMKEGDRGQPFYDCPHGPRPWRPGLQAAKGRNPCGVVAGRNARLVARSVSLASIHLPLLFLAGCGPHQFGGFHPCRAGHSEARTRPALGLFLRWRRAWPIAQRIFTALHLSCDSTS